MANKRKIITKIIFVTVYILFIIILAAICIVIIDIYQYSSHMDKYWESQVVKFDSELGWAPIPYRSTIAYSGNVSYNSFGFRSEEVNSSLSHIIIIGDSVAWGHGVNNEQTISYYLEENIKSFQTLNLGVPGYGIDQSYLFLKRNLDKLNPKYIIIIIYTGNDRVDTVCDQSYGKSKPFFDFKEDSIKNINSNISRYSCSNLISYSWSINQFHSLSNLIRNAFCNSKCINKNSQKRLIKLLLDKINLLASSSNAKVLYVLSPSRNDYDIESRELLFFKEIFKEGNNIYIDVYDEIKKSDIDIDKLYLDHAHYSYFGNKYLARIISREMNISR